MHGLQQRVKWRNVQPNLKIEQLVLLRSSNLSPYQWDLGRITKYHPGDDGIIRVVTVKTAISECKRPIVKLRILPINSVDTIDDQPLADDP